MGKRHNEYFAVLAALILAAVLSTGCSTPPQTGNLYDGQTSNVSYVTPNSYTGSGSYGSNGYANTGTAPAQSYYQCMNVLTQYGVQQQCFQVSNANANSYSQYTYTKAGFAKGISEESKQAAYASYLSSLDESAAADMTAQYDALIAQYSK